MTNISVEKLVDGVKFIRQYERQLRNVIDSMDKLETALSTHIHEIAPGQVCAGAGHQFGPCGPYSDRPNIGLRCRVCKLEKEGTY